MHLDGVEALERVNRLKFFLSRAFVFPDHPLIRIPQKTLDILLPLSATRIKKIVRLPFCLVSLPYLALWRERAYTRLEQSSRRQA
jgi:hypothetical protein